MKRHWLAVLWIIGIGLWVGASSPHQTAWACNGVPPSLQTVIQESTHIVYAVPVERDDANKNGLLYVLNYLKGTGPSHLLLNEMPIRRIILVDEQILPPCGYIEPDNLSNTPAFYFLIQNSDGSYQAISWSNLNIFPPLIPSEQVIVDVEGDPTKRTDSMDVTLEEVYQMVYEMTGEEQHPPDFTSPLPFGSPLLMKTENNTLYLMPVDTRQPRTIAENVGYVTTGQTAIVYTVGNRFEGYTYYPQEIQDSVNSTRTPSQVIELCTHMTCADFSPYNDSFAYMMDPHTIAICHNWQNCPDGNYSVVLPGESFAFSSDGKIAIWSAEKLSIYRLPPVGSEWITPYVPYQQTDLNWGAQNEYTDLAYYAAWSLDGRWLSFADATGLWLWDTQVPSNEAVLVVTNQNGELTIPSKFSQTGRYLHIMQNNAPLLFDLQTNTMLPNDFLGYKDRYIINAPPYAANVDQTHWVNAAYVYALLCEPTSPAACLLEKAFFSRPTENSFDYIDLVTRFAVSYDYEPIWGSLAIAYTDTSIDGAGAMSISIEWPNRPERAIETLNLADYLDSPIVHIEWLPPIYYVE